MPEYSWAIVPLSSLSMKWSEFLLMRVWRCSVSCSLLLPCFRVWDAKLSTTTKVFAGVKWYSRIRGTTALDLSWLFCCWWVVTLRKLILIHICIIFIKLKGVIFDNLFFFLVWVSKYFLFSNRTPDLFDNLYCMLNCWLMNIFYAEENICYIVFLSYKKWNIWLFSLFSCLSLQKTPSSPK